MLNIRFFICSHFQGLLGEVCKWLIHVGIRYCQHVLLILLTLLCLKCMNKGGCCVTFYPWP